MVFFLSRHNHLGLSKYVARVTNIVLVALISTSAFAGDTTKHCCKIPSRKIAIASTTNTTSTKTTKNLPKQSGMVLIKGGRFTMGSKDFPDALPLHEVAVSDFLLDEHEVTNAEFQQFVAATHYLTVAERPLLAKDYPGVPKEKLLAGSAVFNGAAIKGKPEEVLQWWAYVPGANWRHPEGPHSSIKGKERYPVVQISYEDALAYAKWKGKRLPTEAEWEYAAWAGRKNTPFYWGNDLKPSGKWAANIFQGTFPNKNTAEDGFTTTAPVKSFPPNPFGLYDMDGNVWEWCSDLYQPNYYAQSIAVNPQGPATSYDPDEPGVEKHVQRGGSFLCSDQYCIRYKAGSRGKGETTSAGNNQGFRCAKSIK